ncbi:hypothetical protein MMC31_007219 [Peltigera leucophlebia]|nr:hypothetical protein [Peltigera leucophlebia]
MSPQTQVGWPELEIFKQRTNDAESLDSAQTKDTTPQGLHTNHAVSRQVPTVACFVPGLKQGSPFRISLHSWEPPVATRSTKAIASKESMAYFEARVLLDGSCVAGILFNQQSPWPQVIDTVANTDKSGTHGLLKFPPFHMEMLTQSWWSAGENMGRIKIIIAEGLMRSSATSPFERAKNISLDVLEDAGIAWPNPAMWCQMPQRFYSISPPRKVNTRDPDAHEHSPAHRAVRKDRIYTPSDTARPASTSTQELIDQPTAQGTRELHYELEDPCWARMPLLPDPFVDDMSESRPVKQARDDDPNHITTNGAAQDTSPLPESQFDELMASYSPRKDTSSGMFASANLKVAGAVNTPPIQTRFMVASELKVHSYNDEELRSTAQTTRDSELAEVQMDPDSGKRSNHSFGESEQPSTTPRKSTAKDVKSRKGCNLKSDNKIRKQLLAGNHGKEIEMRDAEDPVVVGEGKRKRASTNSKSRQVITSSDSNCSPTRKVSRVEWNGGPQECAGGVMRVRLGSLDNVGRW